MNRDEGATARCRHQTRVPQDGRIYCADCGVIVDLAPKKQAKDLSFPYEALERMLDDKPTPKRRMKRRSQD